jgi:hypothetical protein
LALVSELDDELWRCLGDAVPVRGGGDDIPLRGDIGGAADGVAGSGTLDGESGVDDSGDVMGAAAVEESGAGMEEFAFFSFAAEAVSNAACRRASVIEGVVVFSFAAAAALLPPTVVTSVEVLAGVFEEGAGALAGVVVMDVDFVATGPMASLSSPNSFHSSTCSRS